MKRLLYVVLLLAGAAVVPVGPAQAAACSGTSGVTVVVQFPDHTEIRCAAGDPSSGYQALKSAGFSLTFATGSGAGALCSIDRVPDHECPSMPPTSAYWAYFHAKPGGSWSYSTIGGGGYNPKPGTVEGWRFGGGGGPSTAPPGSASTPIPKPTPNQTPKPAPKPGTQPTAAPATAHPTGAASGSAVGPDGAPTTTTSPAASASAGPDAESAATSGSDPTTAPSDSSAVEPPTSSLPKSDDSRGGHAWIWGVALAGVLAAAAGVTALRRRRS